MRKNKNQKGQSLLEILLALAITIIVLLSLVKVTVTAMRNANFAKNEALASKHAQELIEEARDLRNRNVETFFADGSCDQNDSIGIFTRSRQCSLEDETMTVEAIVSWDDSQGTHQSALSTYLTNWQ